MDPVVKGSFWTDSRIEELDAHHKLAALWLITNPARTLLGFSQTSTKRFLLDTSLSIHALEGVCKALPSSFEGLPGGWYFARNFLRHQFGGKGGQLALNNKVIIAAIRQAKTLPSPLQAAFLAAYPELLESIIEAPSETSPFEGGPHGVTTTTTSGETSGEGLSQGRPGETAAGSIAPETIVAAYPRREATAECLRTVSGHIRAGHDPAAMLHGTREIAAAISQLPSGHLNAYVLSAPRFFRDLRWQDDPSTWLRQAAKAAEKTGHGGKPALTDEERRERLGGRAFEEDFV
jgi:hypothetical protein